ncbi:maleylacetoacetate isomerase [Eoetvoesiella caeni]|uniref:Maleylacetoacetate isomerase n=1 Tax=Eoetvoesiella caeni TaxID=645616 RepID=A0A366GY55_9BURK|nr:maleylacetoacetate isomerase [Eoetvoesiella caeni]MCI2811363.1 maleylacetoacetate isomerase [Eoetvoesiella caeni]NYT57263.1 maleylacetoacetate isomerase [Eoetvoesiella caeni]RBP33561.1 maleylacetoacetate isomerase [Eoetvoesiella caeni]
MDLYSFFNSSTSYRVRIALGIKQLDFNLLPVNIRVMEQKNADYVSKNPGASVPLLDDDGFQLGQSMAIIDYLDAKYPEPRLISADLEQRARVLEISNLISCDMHPLNNLRVLRYLVKDLEVSDEAKNTWYHHWLAEGFKSLEAMLERTQSGGFCVGDQVSLADCCLVPQVANATRMGCDVSVYPRIKAVYDHCNTLPAFQQAAPAVQPDFQK